MEIDDERATLLEETDYQRGADLSPPRKRAKNSFHSLHKEALKTAKEMQTECLDKMDKLIEGNTNVLKAIENANNTQLKLCESINKLIEAIKK